MLGHYMLNLQTQVVIYKDEIQKLSHYLVDF